MPRRRINVPAPLTVGVIPSGEEVEFPTPTPQPQRPSGGLSRATVTSMIRRLARGGAPVRAILPVFDIVTDPGPPGLAYKVAVGDDLGSIVILGENLTGITTVDVSTDVNVGGNGSPPPVVGPLTVTDTSILVPIDASGSLFAGDFWGIILRDAAGNVYGAPSPLNIFAQL